MNFVDLGLRKCSSNVLICLPSSKARSSKSCRLVEMVYLFMSSQTWIEPMTMGQLTCSVSKHDISVPTTDRSTGNASDVLYKVSRALSSAIHDRPHVDFCFKV